jgi:hypothetical protein
MISVDIGFCRRLAELLFLFLLLVLIGRPLQAQKTDVVVLKRGDRITGEIRKMDRGLLELATDDMGTVYIQWIKVGNVRSVNQFEVTLDSGERYFGALVAAGEEKIGVSGEAGELRADMASVASIDRYHRGFFRRMQISFDLGFSYLKANEKLDWDLRSQLKSRSRRTETVVDVVSHISAQRDVEQTSRNRLKITHNRVVRKMGFFSFSMIGEENQELDLDLRVTAGAGWGYFLVRTHRLQVSTIVGLAESREWYADSDVEQWSTDAMIALIFQTSRFRGRRFEIGAAVFYHPSLITRGRHRIDFTAQLRIEVFKNVYWGLNFFDSYDSQPPLEGVEKNDFGISTTIGWARR